MNGPNGNRCQLTDPDGGLTCYQSEGVDNLVGIFNAYREATGIVHDSLNREAQQLTANGVNRNRGFDADGGMVLLCYQTLSGTLRLMHTLTYDAASNLLSQREQDRGPVNYRGANCSRRRDASACWASQPWQPNWAYLSSPATRGIFARPRQRDFPSLSIIGEIHDQLYAAGDSAVQTDHLNLCRPSATYTPKLCPTGQVQPWG